MLRKQSVQTPWVQDRAEARSMGVQSLRHMRQRNDDGESDSCCSILSKGRSEYVELREIWRISTAEKLVPWGSFLGGWRHPCWSGPRRHLLHTNKNAALVRIKMSDLSYNISNF